MHSFLENFNPETGHLGRKALYGNQWVRNAKGEWKELTTAVFTADATARKGFRLDYAGGEQGGKFYLRNCGFFSPNTEIQSVFKRKVVGKTPQIGLAVLVAALENIHE